MKNWESWASYEPRIEKNEMVNQLAICAATCEAMHMSNENLTGSVQYFGGHAYSTEPATLVSGYSYVTTNMLTNCHKCQICHLLETMQFHKISMWKDIQGSQMFWLKKLNTLMEKSPIIIWLEDESSGWEHKVSQLLWLNHFEIASCCFSVLDFPSLLW